MTDFQFIREQLLNPDKELKELIKNKQYKSIAEILRRKMKSRVEKYEISEYIDLGYYFNSNGSPIIAAQNYINQEIYFYSLFVQFTLNKQPWRIPKIEKMTQPNKPVESLEFQFFLKVINTY